MRVRLAPTLLRMVDVEALLRPLPKRPARKPSWTVPLAHLAWHLKLIWPIIYWQILQLTRTLQAQFPGMPGFVYQITRFGRVVLLHHPGDALSHWNRDTAVRAPETCSAAANTFEYPWAEDFSTPFWFVLMPVLRVCAQLNRAFVPRRAATPDTS